MYDLLVCASYSDWREKRLTYEIDGHFSGQLISPPTRWGDYTTVRLIKQTIDEKIREVRKFHEENEVHGRYGKDNKLSAGAAFGKDRPANPPSFEFTMEEPIDDHRAIYCFSRGSPPTPDYASTGVGSVRTVFDAWPWVGQAHWLDAVWFYNSIPPDIEVEAIQVTDRKRFDTLKDEKEKLEKENIRITKDLITLNYEIRAQKMDLKVWTGRLQKLRDDDNINWRRRDEVDRELSWLNPVIMMHSSELKRNAVPHIIMPPGITGPPGIKRFFRKMNESI